MAGKNKLEKSGEGDGVNPKDIESNSGSMVQNLNDVRLQSQAANKCKLNTNTLLEIEGNVF